MPTIKLTIQVSDDEAAQIKAWQVQGLIDSDDDILDSLLLIRSKKKTAEQPATNKYANWSIPQRAILFVGALIIVAMLIFPPYKYYASRSGGFAGYGLIFNPSLRIKPSLTNGVQFEERGGVYLDVITLGVQILLVAAIFGGTAFLLHSRKRS
jgi:hypothetical protein